MTSHKSKIFGCRAEFGSAFHSEQHIQKLYVTYENAACIPFQTPLHGLSEILLRLMLIQNLRSFDIVFAVPFAHFAQVFRHFLC